MVSFLGASIQSSYFSFPFPGETNGIRICRGSVISPAFLRKSDKGKVSGKPKTMAFNMKIKGSLRQDPITYIHNVKVEREYTEFPGITKSMDTRTSQTNSLSRYLLSIFNLCTVGCFFLNSPLNAYFLGMIIIGTVSNVLGMMAETSVVGCEYIEKHVDKAFSAYNRSLIVYCKASTSGDFSSITPSQMSLYERIIETLTTLFPVWVILGTVIGIYKPAMVTWLETDLFTVGLGFLMLSMGLTLTFEDFRRCLRNPWTVGVGFLAQYIIKPMLGFFIAMTLKLSAPLATGLILVSCCPGGQASNVATYISKGNVALSVLMTTCSTIGAIVMTPLLTKLLAGQLVPVDAAGLALSTFQVVLVPTIIGVLLNEFLPKFTSKIVSITPLIGVILTTLLCASPIGQVSEVLKTQGTQLLLPVALLHAAAFFLGYLLSKTSFGESTSRTISIECGMQSSALGFLLAQKHFTNPLVAVPSAVSVVCMALGGSALAVYWRNQPIPVDDKDDFKE